MKAFFKDLIKFGLLFAVIFFFINWFIPFVRQGRSSIFVIVQTFLIALIYGIFMSIYTAKKRTQKGSNEKKRS
jgi:hypothetical protein